MKQKFLFTIIAIFLASSFYQAQAQESEKKKNPYDDNHGSFLTYYNMGNMMQVAPTAMKFGLYGFSNPAISSYLHDSDHMIVYSANNKEFNDFNMDRLGFFSGSPHWTSGLMRVKDGSHSAWDYRFGFSMGSRIFSLGLGYGFTGGDKSYFGRSNVFTWGAMWRPVGQLSVSAHQTIAMSAPETESVVEIAVRPIESIPIALFADGAIMNNQKLNQAKWSAGISAEVLDGVRLNARYFDDKSFGLGVDLSFGEMGISGHRISNSDGEGLSNTVVLRHGAKDRTIFSVPFKEEPVWFMKLDLSGTIKYQSSIWFGSGKSLISILASLDEAMDNDLLKGVVINATNIRADKEIMWEIRDKLKKLRKAGKEVVIFTDRMGITQYHFASVADKIVMDKLGLVMLEGYSLNRSYYKNLLEKLGIGFEEFRYFKYKSAAESYARDNMSDGDREQRQRLVDEWYEIARAEICDDRGFTENEFDKLSDENLLYHSDVAMDKKLVDHIGRWVDVDDVLEEIYGDDVSFMPALLQLIKRRPEPFDDKWSQPSDKIAVIYALGICAMDQGISSRKLIKDLKRAFDDDGVKAIVLRVDSPGGDAMASDYIAKYIKDHKKDKPVIVSQGAVAASGGYWLSMYGDKILAAPNTITGSIGVISSWMYDKGLSDSLGIDTEGVKRGKYSDLGSAFALPFIPIGLPLRNFTDEEKEMMKNNILKSYGYFVQQVAEGRGMDSVDVHKVAQGRVWSGRDGYDKGLIDKLGGLDDAIYLAAEMADMEVDYRFSIVEYPKARLFDFGSMMGGVFGFEVVEAAQKINALKFNYENNGIPMHMLPIDYIEDPIAY